MAMKAKAIILLLAATLLAACSGESTQTVKVDGRYAIDLPSFLTETTDLNAEASLQYQNTFKEFYVIVIDEPKTELIKALDINSMYDRYTADLKGYSELVTDGMDSSIATDSLPAFEETTINGSKARLLSFEGLSSGYKVYWKLAFIEGNNRYYQVMTWTLAESRTKYEDEMLAIINSFKETDKSKKR
jgi:hypothetical protein